MATYAEGISMLNHGSPYVWFVWAFAFIKTDTGAIVAIPIVMARILKATSFFRFSLVFSPFHIPSGQHIILPQEQNRL
jgi:hypothetical protein